MSADKRLKRRLSVEAICVPSQQFHGRISRAFDIVLNAQARKKFEDNQGIQEEEPAHDSRPERKPYQAMEGKDGP